MAKSQRRAGLDAHRNTIGPSQDIFENMMHRKYPNRLVTQSKGVPDVVVYGKGTKFYEIKPNRLFSKGKMRTIGAKRKYLNENQEKTIKRLLSYGAKNIFIVYYNRMKNKKFEYCQVKITKKNISKYCYTTPFNKRKDPDELGW